jgi:hypothetical protein
VKRGTSRVASGRFGAGYAGLIQRGEFTRRGITKCYSDKGIRECLTQLTHKSLQEDIMTELSYQITLAAKATFAVVGGVAIVHWVILKLRGGGK